MNRAAGRDLEDAVISSRDGEDIRPAVEHRPSYRDAVVFAVVATILAFLSAAPIRATDWTLRFHFQFLLPN